MYSGHRRRLRLARFEDSLVVDVSTLLVLFGTRFLGVFVEAVFFLLMGALVSGLIEVFVRREDLIRFLPRRPILAILAGSMLGFLFPVCECGVVPVTRRLYQKGLPIPVGITFLLAAPVINPVVLASTYAAFGFGPVLIGRCVITLIMALGVGLLFTLQDRPQRLVIPNVLAATAEAPRLPLIPGLIKALKLAGKESFEFGRYLVVGTSLAAAMQTFIARDQARAVATDPVLSVLALAALAFILSVSSATDASSALVLASSVNGFTTGSILTFLTLGPVIDIKNVTLYLSVFRRRAVLYLIVFPLLISVLIGIWLNLNVRF
jgi:uncharacterized membrane protein YraQ (UPF0718 family)